MMESYMFIQCSTWLMCGWKWWHHRWHRCWTEHLPVGMIIRVDSESWNNMKMDNERVIYRKELMRNEKLTCCYARITPPIMLRSNMVCGRICEFRGKMKAQNVFSLNNVYIMFDSFMSIFTRKTIANHSIFFHSAYFLFAGHFILF